jgi:hypothetical protein
MLNQSLKRRTDEAIGRGEATPNPKAAPHP